MKTSLDNMIEDNNKRFDMFSAFVKEHHFCEYAEMLGGCSECPCNIHDNINGDGDMECALKRVEKMLMGFDEELNDRKARIVSERLGARRFPDCYNTH